MGLPTRWRSPRWPRPCRSCRQVNERPWAGSPPAGPGGEKNIGASCMGRRCHTRVLRACINPHRPGGRAKVVFSDNWAGAHDVCTRYLVGRQLEAQFRASVQSPAAIRSLTVWKVPVTEGRLLVPCIQLNVARPPLPLRFFCCRPSETTAFFSAPPSGRRHRATPATPTHPWCQAASMHFVAVQLGCYGEIQATQVTQIMTWVKFWLALRSNLSELGSTRR